MAVRRGFKAVTEASKQTQRGDSYRFRLDTGETALIRAHGDFENELMPVVCDRHYIKRLRGADAYQMCGTNAPDGTHAGCVFCYARDHKDKGVGMSPLALFDITDLRKIHKLSEEVRVLKPGVIVRAGTQAKADDYVKTKYPYCRGALKCQFCKGGHEAFPQGRRHWELANMHAEGLSGKYEEARQFCTCGARTEDGGPTLYASSYICGNVECGQEIDYDPEQDGAVKPCGYCRQAYVPVEILACTNPECSEPTRCKLDDFVIKVGKTGADKKTTYNFELVHPCQPLTAEERKEIEEAAIDLDALAQPLPAEMQAKLLNIPSPFSTPGHGASGFTSDIPDEGDDTQYGEPEDEQEEEAAPEPSRWGRMHPAVPPARPAPRPAAAAPPPRPAAPPPGLRRAAPAAAPRDFAGRPIPPRPATGRPTFGTRG